MSVVGFHARNHPQQVGKRGPNPAVDDRAITPSDFAPLHERFHFTIDAAASPQNARLPRYWTEEIDALTCTWRGERVWCNPPYSNIEPWVQKANGAWQAKLVVMLLPANRTEQGWWQRWVEPGRRAGTLDVEFLAGRMRFLNPGDDEIKPNARPPFGCCLVIWGRDA